MLVIASSFIFQADQLTEEQIAGKTSLHWSTSFLLFCKVTCLMDPAMACSGFILLPFKAFFRAAYRS